MQLFTLDQAIITGLLFILGLLIGMFFLAGGKWKRRYLAEAQRRAELEREVEQLRRDWQQVDSRQGAAVVAPGRGSGGIPL